MKNKIITISIFIGIIIVAVGVYFSLQSVLPTGGELLLEDTKIITTEEQIVFAEPLTLTETTSVLEKAKFTKDEAVIYKTIFQDKKRVKFDLSQMTTEDINTLLLGIMLKLGDSKESLAEELTKKGKVNFDERVIKLTKEYYAKNK